MALEKKPLVKEQNLPGIEPEPYPPGLEKAITKYHAADAAKREADREHKQNIDEAFSAVKRMMHEHDIKEVKLRINGDWKMFKLKATEKGQFKKIKPENKSGTTKVKKSKK